MRFSWDCNCVPFWRRPKEMEIMERDSEIAIFLWNVQPSRSQVMQRAKGLDPTAAIDRFLSVLAETCRSTRSGLCVMSLPCFLEPSSESPGNFNISIYTVWPTKADRIIFLCLKKGAIGEKGPLQLGHRKMIPTGMAAIPECSPPGRVSLGHDGSMVLVDSLSSHLM